MARTSRLWSAVLRQSPFELGWTNTPLALFRDELLTARNAKNARSTAQRSTAVTRLKERLPTEHTEHTEEGHAQDLFFSPVSACCRVFHG